MKLLRILMVSDSLTFSAGLESLLRTEPHLEVIGQERDVSRVINYLKQLKPDVIIWANTGLSRDAVEDELRLLKATPTIKMVSLNLCNNEITIYQSGRKCVRVARQVADLIEALTGDLLPQDNTSSGRQVYDEWAGSGQQRQPVTQPSLLPQPH